MERYAPSSQSERSCVKVVMIGLAELVGLACSSAPTDEEIEQHATALAERAVPLVLNGAFCKGGPEAFDRSIERMERIEDLPETVSNKE